MRDPIFNVWNITALVLIVFYSSLILFRSKNERVINTLPSFSTGIGILFTFLILFKNLGVEEIQLEVEELRNLVKKLASAFSTSIIGIFCSLILSPIVKWKISHLEKSNFLEAKSKGIQNAILSHPHELLFKLINSNQTLVEEVKRLSGTDENSSSLGDIHSEISLISSNVLQEIQQLFSTLGNELKENINSLGSNAIDDSKNNIAQINQTFISQTSTLLKGNMEAMEILINKLEGTMSQAANEMGTIKKQIHEDTLQSKENAQKLTSTIANSFQDSVSGIAAKFGTESNEISATIQKLSDTIIGLETDFQNRIEELMENNISTLQKSFDKLEEFQVTSQGKLEATTNHFAEAVNQFKGFNKENFEIGENLKRQFEISAETQLKTNELLERWGEVVESIQKLDDHVAQINNLILNLNRIKETLPQ